MSKSLSRLEEKKRNLGMKKLAQIIDVDRWLAMCDADTEAMNRLKNAWPIRLPSFVAYYAQTVCGILGLPNNCKEEAPKAAAGEVVVWYDGWTLGELVATDKVANLLSKKWEAWQAPAGYYHTRIPVPKSNRMTYDERTAYRKRLYAALGELPVPIGATALAVHLAVTGEDLLKGNFCACAETLPGGVHAGLYVGEGLVHVCNYWDDYRHVRLFGGGARKS